MVFQKRLDYGFDGYQVPPIPRSTRSTRKRGGNWRKADVNHICAFDLLATVAGNLLLEGENSPHSANTSSAREHSALMKDCIKEEKQSEEQTMQEKPCDQGSSERGFFLSELVSQAPMLSNCSSEFPLSQNDTLSAPVSVITTSDCSEKFATMEHLVNGGNKLELGSLNRKADLDVSGCKVFSNRKLGFEFGKPGSKDLVNDVITSADNKAGICISGFPVLGNRKPSTLVCSDDSVKLTPPKDHISCVSFPVKRDDVKLGSRDDDENSSGCTQPSTASKVFRQAQPYIEDRKSGKLSAPKYLEVNPKSNDEEHLNADVETRHAFDNSKNSFKHQRSLKDYPFKKRKLYDCSSVSISDVGIRNDGICSCPSKRYNGGASSYTLTLPSAHPVAGTSSSAAGESASFRSGDSQVKLRIKSFRIPELFIEIPETATIGSLKRTVMEAVTTILGGGLRVGVLFQGKKVRDDSKTLLQTGICHDNKLNAVGFTLEPNPSQDPPPPMCPKEHPYLLSRDSPQPLSRYPSSPSVIHNAVQRGPNSALHNPRGTSVINFFESDHDSAPSPPDILLNKRAADSRALVAVPSGNAEPLSVAPGRKPKRSETAQRRIRRPFSVSEVEALVQAVEKLGTGRWRDVKMRAFDNAKHRTYVDLKDKWKTLVHTARISPQQRRGEPVPQELLDRVLAAHAYWSQQQTKQQMKHHSATCFLL